MGIREQAEESSKWVAGWWANFGSYWVTMGVGCVDDSGVADASNGGIWPLGCTSTHLAPIPSPSASWFSWALSLSLSASALWFVIEVMARKDCLPRPGTGISKDTC